ncbi:hypothetical protein L226DRAFT_541196 [Lentinus tigrinus ALCF2SS1-7]|nr:hypothetical protein L227DRAFT_80504 [Lentinus tigrinus ALCF2SS1-6]RPD67731.1 hypothetical protein L226DRAFT_541199 [Lentinus tigrinus ALCF2SS1-7]RPD67754.1 hypothetical protein L226DRAFT_541196 [Lentinus tigrinus ALCF2SS1-7]
MATRKRSATGGLHKFPGSLAALGVRSSLLRNAHGTGGGVQTETEAMLPPGAFLPGDDEADLGDNGEQAHSCVAFRAFSTPSIAARRCRKSNLNPNQLRLHGDGSQGPGSLVFHDDESDDAEPETGRRKNKGTTSHLVPALPTPARKPRKSRVSNVSQAETPSTTRLSTV